MFLLKLDELKYKDCTNYVIFCSIGQRGVYKITFPNSCRALKLVETSQPFHRGSPEFFCNINIVAEGLTLIIKTDESNLISYGRAVQFKWSLVTEGPLEHVRSLSGDIKFAKEFRLCRIQRDCVENFAGRITEMIEIKTIQPNFRQSGPRPAFNLPFSVPAGAARRHSPHQPPPGIPRQSTSKVALGTSGQQLGPFTPVLAGASAGATHLATDTARGRTWDTPDFSVPIKGQSEGNNSKRPKKEEFKFSIIALRHKNEPFEIEVSPEANIEDIIALVVREYEKRNWETLDQRVLFQGKNLEPAQKIAEVEGLKNGDTLHMVDQSPPRQIGVVSVRSAGQEYPEYARQIQDYLRQQQRQGRIQQQQQGFPVQNSAHARLNNCFILYRNFDACVNASVSEMDPSTRTRHNHPVSAPPANPGAQDLGNHVIDLAGTIRQWALELNRLSDVMIRDVDVTNDADARENLRRLIQNNMDAARYLHPYLQNLTQFCIPLNVAPPRRLIVSEPRRPASTNQGSGSGQGPTTGRT